jgi:hypothetical protein
MSRFGLLNATIGLMLVGALSVGCGDDGSSDTTPTDGGGITSDASSTTAGDKAAGQTAATSRGCPACHTASAGLFAGSPALKGPNLTPDTTTGIGSWTNAQIATAILDAKDEDGATLGCGMAAYRKQGMAQAEADNIAAYLKSLPAIKNDIGAECN